MKWFILLIILCFLKVISACSSTSTTAMLVPTATTPLPIVLVQFTPHLVGVGTQGNMVCIKYQGGQTNLAGIKR